MPKFIQRVLPSVILAVIFCAMSVASDAVGLVGGNSYYLFTKELLVNQDGVVAVPSRYKWSVETSHPPDGRILLRLYDPDQNFTAFISQLDLQTAEKLHQELGHVLANKKENPNFQHKPKLYPDSMIPKAAFKGIRSDGTMEIELVYPDKKAD